MCWKAVVHATAKHVDHAIYCTFRILRGNDYWIDLSDLHGTMRFGGGFESPGAYNLLQKVMPKFGGLASPNLCCHVLQIVPVKSDRK